MDFAHIRLPQRCRGAGTGGLGRKRLVIVMSDPQGRGVISRDSGKEHALLVGVCAGLPADGLPLDPCAGSRTGGYDGFQHIHNQPARTLRKHPVPFLMLVSVPDHIAAGIGNAQHGDRLLVYAAVGKHAEGNRHLQRRDAGGTQAQAERRLVNMIVVNPHTVEIGNAAVHAHPRQQRLGCRRVVGFGHGRPQGFRSGISGTAVVLRPAVVPFGILPSGDGKRHVVYH